MHTIDKKEVIIRTKYRREYFEIRETEALFQVYRFSSGFFRNRKSSMIGETRSWDEAMECIKRWVGPGILDIEITH